MDFNLEWTVFALEAEEDTWGFVRIAKAHNKLRDQLAEKEQENAELKQRVEELSKVPEKWRCFHCGFETSDEKEAAAHFGDQDNATTLCADWAEYTTHDEKLAHCQQLEKELSSERDENWKLCQSNDALQYQVDSFESAIQSFKPFRGCHNVQDIFNLYDTLEGLKVVAEKRVEELEQHQPLSPFCINCETAGMRARISEVEQALKIYNAHILECGDCSDCLQECLTKQDSIKIAAALKGE